MSEVLTINNVLSTYIEKLRPNNNFYRSNYLLCGTFYVNQYTYDIYKTLLKFSIPNIDTGKIEKISLFIFISNSRLYNSSSNISISTSTTAFDTYTVTWNTAPHAELSNSITKAVTYNDINKYIEIDITSIVKNTEGTTGLILESSDINYPSILQFTASNSYNSPYILITLSTPTVENSNIKAQATTNSNNTPINNENNIETTNSGSNLVDLEKRIDNVEATLTNINDTINTVNTNYDMNKDRISKLETTTANINEIINTLNTNYDINKNMISKLETTLSSIINHLSEIEVKLSQNSSENSSENTSKITDINSRIDNINSRITEMNNLENTEISAIKDNINTLTTTLNDFADKLNNINIRIDNLQSNINNSSDSSMVNNAIADLTSNVNNSISDLTEKLNSLSENYNNLLTRVNSLVIEPLDYTN